MCHSSLTKENRAMRYTLIDKTRAVAAEFKLDGHKVTADNKVLLNEKEVMQNQLLNGSMEDRCTYLGGYPESLDSIRLKTSNNEIIWEQ